MSLEQKEEVAEESYTAKNIMVLEGLEAVRKRPSMYIGGVHKTGLHHMLWEIVDNAIDEVINGFASRIKIHLHRDGETISVSDNGRGIPVDKHPKHKKSALELILTVLHAGGKFEKGNYIHSGGLHGVGASVVNALSSVLIAEVKRNKIIHRQTFERGNPVTGLQKVGKTRQTGTEITFKADTQIFQKNISFDPSIIFDRLDVAAYLHKGLQIRFIDDTNNSDVTLFHEGGLQDYLDHIVNLRAKKQIHPEVFSFASKSEVRMEVSMCWTEGTDESFRSFVNGIPTRSGGSHVNGLKASIVKGIRKYINTHKLAPKGLSFNAEDIREGLVGLISIYILEPQFQGQTKERLNNPEVQPLVEQILRPAFEQWLHQNSSQAKAIVERIIISARARQASRAASQLVRRQSPTRRLTLPGKLADCSEQDPRKSELFIVEGDSAGGSAKLGRDRKTQAILPLRGKVLNTETASLKRVVSNKEIADVIQALGCGIDKDFKRSALRYDKIILLMDADADGHHISTLLLTFFYRHLPDLVNKGHVYIAQPPLYRITVGKKVHWVLDDAQREKILSKAPEGAKIDIQRFKGLGEMMPKTLKETTLDPKKRTLLRVKIVDELSTDLAFSELLGKDASARYRFIMERSHEVDDIDMGA